MAGFAGTLLRSRLSALHSRVTLNPRNRPRVPVQFLSG